MKSTMRMFTMLGMALLLATVAGGETHTGDWDVTGEITASGNFATFGDSSYVVPFAGWSGSSRMVAVRQPTAVSTGVSSGFMFSNNQTSGAFKNIAQLMFINEASALADKRVAQILVQTGGNINSGKMFFRVYDSGSATDALVINRFGGTTVKFADGETQTTAFMGATSGGGNHNVGGTSATVGGGYNNTASYASATISGGRYNVASDDSATVGGGENNTVSASHSTVAGGESNLVTDDYSTVGGGEWNQAGDSAGTTGDADYATVGGGNSNTAGAQYSTVGGGNANLVTDDYGTIGGGDGNQAGNDAGTMADVPYATVGGGENNTASGYRATVGGGYNNTASYVQTTIGGGYNNTASDYNATVGGGSSNDATGDAAAVPGGYNNTASGDRSFAAGYNATASHNNSFVWGDDGGGTSAAANTFNVHASGGIYYEGGSIHTPSDRNKKENFEPVDSRAVLAKVAALPMSTWNYKTEDGKYLHMGPMGQDFHAAFGLGTDEKHITTVDADGVALAAIQGLNQRMNEVVQENVALKARLAALEEAISKE